MFNEKTASADADLLADLSRGCVSPSRVRAMGLQQAPLLAHALSCEATPTPFVHLPVLQELLIFLSPSPKGSDRGLLHALVGPAGKRTAGEKSVGENTPPAQTAAFQVNTHTGLLSFYVLAGGLLMQLTRVAVLKPQV